MTDFKQKYLKYKKKYLDLQQMRAGMGPSTQNEDDKIDKLIDDTNDEITDIEKNEMFRNIIIDNDTFNDYNNLCKQLKIDSNKIGDYNNYRNAMNIIKTTQGKWFTLMNNTDLDNLKIYLTQLRYNLFINKRDKLLKRKKELGCLLYKKCN